MWVVMGGLHGIEATSHQYASIKVTLFVGCFCTGKTKLPGDD